MSQTSAPNQYEIDRVLGQLDGVAPSGDHFMARCPAHSDSNPSLSIRADTDDGSLRFHCFAGCSTDEIRQALGLGIWMPGDGSGTDVYDYTTADGDPLFQVVRGVDAKGSKTFRQRRQIPGSGSGWRWSVKDLSAEDRETLFMAPAVAAGSQSGSSVYVVEGEKDVVSAVAEGAIATCNAGGAGKFTNRHAAQLKDADVIIVQDKDDAGRRHGSAVHRLLTDVARSVRLVEAAAGKDLTDHLQAGHGLDDLIDVQPQPVAVASLPISERGVEAAVERSAYWTDAGVAARFAAESDGSLLWSKAFGWRRWDGRTWALTTDESVVADLTRFARADLAEVARSNGELGPAVARLSKKSLAAAESLARGQAEHRAADFDTYPDIAVAENGVIDLETGDLLPHDSTRLVTMSTAVAYVPGARHPDWDAALEAVPPEVADYLQIRYGQALTGHVPDDDVMTVLRGDGENGKSTLLGAILNAFGDYARIIPDDVLMADVKGHPTELMTLLNLRLAVIEETAEARRFDMQKAKKVLGCPELTARFLYRDFVTFSPTWAVAISSNYELGVEEVDTGTWRRLTKIDFPYRYRKPHEPLEEANDRRGDPRLRDAVKRGREQQEAVLAWLVEGARRWYANGRRMAAPPQKVTDDTLEWRHDCDQWLKFADSKLVVETGAAIWMDDLLLAVKDWQAGQGHQAWGAPKLKARMSANPWMKKSSIGFSGQETRDPATLSRPGYLGPLKPAPSRPRCLLGARFRTVADDAADLAAEGAPNVPGPQPAPGGTAPNTAKRDRPCEPGRVMPVITDVDEVA